MNAVSIRKIANYIRLGVLVTTSLSCNGQAVRPLSIGGILVPKPTGILGRQDAAAVAELTAHRTAVGSTQWEGMQGTGTITYGPQSSISFSATLSNLRSEMFRLDVQEQSGVTSTRIHGPLGKIQGGDGLAIAMPTNTALAGIYPFERLRRLNVSSPKISLIEGGIVNIGTVQLHRISLEYEAIGGEHATHAKATIATDLYFDPTTHLLSKSVSLRAASSGRQANFLVVTSYDDYRTVGTSLIPFRFTETMEGQPYSTLQLSSVDLKPSLTSKYFEF